MGCEAFDNLAIERFDLREFPAQVLEAVSVPLWARRELVNDWIAAEAR